MVAAEQLSNFTDLTPDQAECWVAAALAEARALRQHDEHLFPPPDDTAGAGVSEKLRAAWRAWADGAEIITSRIQCLMQGSGHIAGAYDLDYEIGRARAMLNLSPEKLDARRWQVSAGQVQTAAEVRRELRPSHRG